MRRLASEHAGEILRLQRAVRDAGLTMDEVVVNLGRRSILVQERRAADALTAPSPFPISGGPKMPAADCRVSEVGPGFHKGGVVSRGLSGKAIPTILRPGEILMPSGSGRAVDRALLRGLGPAPKSCSCPCHDPGKMCAEHGPTCCPCKSDALREEAEAM